jgi:medium-chain acyl-[acyl-carrier-protein] hydrolase
LKKAKVFFLPYAGGSARVYLSWKKFFNNSIDLIPIELAGRGRRIHEPLFESMEEAVNDAFKQIHEELNDAPYVIYGHSMGTIIAYELARKISMHGLPEPAHMFFSGRYPPYVQTPKEQLHQLADQLFIDRIMEYEGANKEAFQIKELLDMIMPILRSDYMIVETYEHSEDILILNCDISVLNGKQDAYIQNKSVERWSECTNKICTFYEFEGGHFFINQHKEEIANIISRHFNLQ